MFYCVVQTYEGAWEVTSYLCKTKTEERRAALNGSKKCVAILRHHDAAQRKAQEMRDKDSKAGAKHSPGPWTAEECGSSEVATWHVRDANRHLVAIGRSETRDGPRGQTEAANASLIAAAPDLLAVCKDAIKWFQGGQVGIDIWARLEIAIAEAEGGAA